MVQKLFTYFGNKQRIAKTVWPFFGQTDTYTEPFAGCAAMLLSSPYNHTFECINDADCYVVNAHRAVKYYPEDVKNHLYNPRFEMDLHARHDYLVTHKKRFEIEMYRQDPRFCDPELAAWWIWGINLWIGGNWCSTNHTTKTLGTKCKPTYCNMGVLRTKGQKPIARNQGALKMWSAKPSNRKIGVLSNKNSDLKVETYTLDEFIVQKPKIDRVHIIDEMVTAVFDRLTDTNILYGDFERCLTHSYTTAFGTSAVFLDPPYMSDSSVYEHDTEDTWTRAKNWFEANRKNPKYRIILCGEEQFWPDYPADLRRIEWDRSGGYIKDKSKRREIIWISDHCL